MSSPAMSLTQSTDCSARSSPAAARDHAVRIELPNGIKTKANSRVHCRAASRQFYCERAVPVSVCASHVRGYLMPQDAKVWFLLHC